MRELKVEDKVIPLKPNKDARLSHHLTLDEFIREFTMYKQVICEAYPTRWEELDKYMAFMVSWQELGVSPASHSILFCCFLLRQLNIFKEVSK